MMNKFIPVCQYCGKTGGQTQSPKEYPTIQARVPGKCPSHPSGNPNMPHSPKWVKL